MAVPSLLNECEHGAPTNQQGGRTETVGTKLWRSLPRNTVQDYETNGETTEPHTCSSRGAA